MKFSIIVPVYNVEAYIGKCLESILGQSYSEFEIIVVNDGSKDNSGNIIQEYEKKDRRIRYFLKKNGGLSDARNYGIKYVTGDYILFLDSDDYLEKDLLFHLHEVLEEKKVDLVRFSFQKVDEKGNVLQKIISDTFLNLEMEKALCKILNQECVETAWSYAYRTKFFLENEFQYPKGYYHEDYGLTPYIILKAKDISAFSYVGINYVQRSGSIMNSNVYEKEIEKVEHAYRLFIIMRERINDLNTTEFSRRTMMGFMTRVLLEKISTLKQEEKNRYFLKTKELNLNQYIIQKGIKGWIKRIWAKINWCSFCKYFY